MNEATKELTPKDYAKMEQSATIINALSNGKSMTRAAREAGISRQTAYRRLTDQYCQNILQNSIKTQIAALPGATRKLIKHCHSDNEKISLDAIIKLQENTGVRPSKSVNQVLVNIYNQTNTVNMLDPRLQSMLGNAMGGLLEDPDVQEAEVIND